MVVSAVSGFNPSQYANSLKNSERVISYSNAVASDTVSFGGGIQKVKPTHLGIGGAMVLGLLALAGCTQATSPTITPETPVTPVTPVTPDSTLLDVEKNFATVMGPLDPIVETESSLTAKAATSTVNGLESFSYEYAGSIEKFDVTAVDSATGVLTAQHTKSYVDDADNVIFNEEVQLAKTDNGGWKIIHDGGAYEAFLPLENAAQKNYTAADGYIVSARTLKKGSTVGEVLLTDASGVSKGVWTNFKTVVSEAASNLLTKAIKSVKSVR